MISAVCRAREKSDEQITVSAGRPHRSAAASACRWPSSDSPQSPSRSVSIRLTMTPASFALLCPCRMTWYRFARRSVPLMWFMTRPTLPRPAREAGQ